MSVLSAHQSTLLIIDMQTGLLPAIHDTDALLQRASHLAQAARLCQVPVLATEHWTEKIGPTHAELLSYTDQVLHKTHFDATREADFLPALPKQRPKVLLMGTESHICVLQTGLSLKDKGYEPVLVSDCVGSRKSADWLAAQARWDHYGLERVTAEMVMFEWLETPANPAFKAILKLVK